MKMFRKEEGFTLVELMVVVLIIGILVAIAIPVFNAARGNAQKRSCQANLRTINGAIEQWRAEDSTNEVSGLGTTVNATHALVDAEEGPLKAAPTCPAGTNTDFYTLTVTGDAASAACPLIGTHADHKL